MTNNRLNLSTAIAALLTLFSLSTFASIVWGSGRSLGISDEGLYLLAARYPDEIAKNVSVVYSYTGFLFRMVDYDVARFRIVGLVLIILSAVIFWLGFCKFVFAHWTRLTEIHNFRWLSFVFITMGGLLHYQWSLATPSYYTLTAVAVSSSAGFTLFALGTLAAVKRPALAYAAFACSGLGIGAAFFIKFPTGVSLCLITVALIALWITSPIRERLNSALEMVAGFGMWVLLHFVLVQGPETTASMFHAGWSLYQTLGMHDPAVKILAYPKNMLVLTCSALGIYWPSYVLLIVFAVWRKVNSKAFRRFFPDVVTPVGIVIAVAAMLSVKAVVFTTAAERYQDGSFGMTQFYLAFYFAWILLLLATRLFIGPANQTVAKPVTLARHEYWVVLLFLFLVPFTAAVGTSNPLYNVISFYSPPWFGLLLFLSATPVQNVRVSSNLFSVVLLLIGSFAATNTIFGSILAPSLLQPVGTNLIDENVPTKVGFPSHETLLNPELHRVIEELRSLVITAGFTPGDDIIAVSYMPGLVFALGARSPGHPTFLLWNDKYLEYSKMALQFSDASRRRKALLLVNKDLTQATLQDLLNSGGLDYPARYQKIGVVSGLGTEYTLYRPSD